MTRSSDFETDQLKAILGTGTADEQLSALSQMTPKSVQSLIDEVITLTYHWRPEIRATALRALRAADGTKLIEVLRNSLRDQNQEVRIAAAEIFHRDDKKIAA